MMLFVFQTAPEPVAVSKPETTAYPMPVRSRPMIATSEVTTLDGVIVNRPMYVQHQYPDQGARRLRRTRQDAAAGANHGAGR